MQDPKEAFITILQKFTSAINRIVSATEVRWILIESLPLENGNSECKKMIKSLKETSISIDKFIRNIAVIGSHT